MVNSIFEKIMLIIDTNQYSDEFRKQICAYITGQTVYTHLHRQTEDHRGKVESEEAKKELTTNIYEWFKKHIQLLTDEEGISNIAIIYPTPGLFNDGFGHVYKEGNFDSVKHRFMENMISEYDDYTYLIEKSIKEKRHEQPVYKSIGICFDAIPSQDIIELIKERTTKYTSLYNKDLKIENFRLLTYYFNEQSL